MFTSDSFRPIIKINQIVSRINDNNDDQINNERCLVPFRIVLTGFHGIHMAGYHCRYNCQFYLYETITYVSSSFPLDTSLIFYNE